jgi:aryl-alcohol dehydrogenase-like predicted oxidoreductase
LLWTLVTDADDRFTTGDIQRVFSRDKTQSGRFVTVQNLLNIHAQKIRHPAACGNLNDQVVAGSSLAQGALGWLLAKSARNISLPGARTAEQVQDNAGAIELGPLPAAVMAEIKTLVERDPEGEARAR